ncbi:MAG TPA: glycosyltransferase family 2 protein [Candidatus Paceibacterota bacterium]
MKLTHKKISVVVVCYHDEYNILALYERLSSVLKDITSSYEIIYVNDASPDNSEMILRDLAAKDSALTVVNHSRNFGAQAAFTSGMAQASGDAVVIMDGDLQDPPELIVEFVKQWNKGFSVVYGTRKKREPSMGKVKAWLFYHLFYIIFSRLAYIPVQLDAGDFSLMDRVVIDHLNAMPERDRFIRGLRAWVGYRSVGIPYERPERYDGRKGVSVKGFLGGFRWARKAIYSFSYKPLEMVTYLALGTTAFACIGVLYYVVSFFLTDAPRGISTIIVLILFFSAVQLLTLSIVGEYVGRIFEETKGRPRFIIRDIINDHKKKQP